RGYIAACWGEDTHGNAFLTSAYDGIGCFLSPPFSHAPIFGMEPCAAPLGSRQLPGRCEPGETRRPVLDCSRSSHSVRPAEPPLDAQQGSLPQGPLAQVPFAPATDLRPA